MNKRFTLEKIANIVDCEHKTAPHTENGKYYLIRTSAIQNGKIDFENADRISYETYLEWTKRKLPKPGDIILAREAPVGEVGLIEEGYEVCLGQRTVLIQANNKLVCSKYLLYFLISPEAKDRFKACSTGSVVLHLNVRDIRSFALSLPPFSKQETIAHYLDTKTAQIDRKIDLLTQKATLYSNLKQSLINETVTRGLDKTVPMKDSGIDAIGKVPKHWEVKRLKDLFDIQNSNVDKKLHDNEIPVKLCNYVDVYKNEFINALLDFTDATASKFEIKQFAIKKGDVFITKDSETCDDIAIPALATESLNNVLCGYHLARLRAKEKVFLGSYLFRLFQSQSYGFRFVISAKGITRVGLGQSAIADSLTPVPPISEQTAIAHHLDTKTAQIDQIIQTINTQIERLKELRKTLINDVVTGKIKVVENEH